jgi:hypothetical protein
VRRLLFVLAAVTGLASAWCSSKGGAGDDGNVPLPDRTRDSGGGSESPDAASPEAPGDAGIDAAFDCDRDKDGFLSLACDGSDCDDDDPFAHPDAGFSRDAATAKTKGDWNCDGKVDKEQRTNMFCAGFDMLTCQNRTGFTGDPPCGQTGPFVACALINSNCQTVAMPTGVIQACR